VVRTAEIGLLYDPRRAREARFADDLQAAILPGASARHLRIRRNYPYRGVYDGFMTHLRTVFPASRYVGLEIEMNQRIAGTAAGQRQLAGLIGDALAQLMGR
jgi:hypothetical protein